MSNLHNFFDVEAQEKKEVIKSVQYSDWETLTHIKNLYLNGENFDLDPCFSTGKFYKNIEEPRYKFDKIPQRNDVTENDILNGLPIENNFLNGIVFDPPFVFGNHGKIKTSTMAKRFTIFESWIDLENMYRKSLTEFYRILKYKGIVAFKCQDFTDKITTLTHCHVHNWAIETGFKTEDLFILVFTGGRIWNSKLKQRHARKYHSYWFVLRK